MAFIASLLLKTQGRVVGFASCLDESNEPSLAFDELLFQQRVKSKWRFSHGHTLTHQSSPSSSAPHNAHPVMHITSCTCIIAELQ